MQEQNKGLLSFIAECQGDFFRYIAGHYDALVFLPRYMESSFMNDHLDHGSVFDFMYPPELLYNAITISPELQSYLVTERGDLNEDVAEFAGEMYRRLSQENGVSSADLVHVLPLEYMASIYPSYHTFTNDDYLLGRMYEDYERRRDHHGHL